MKITSLNELISVIIVITLGLILLNPFDILMPSMLEMTLYGFLLLVTAIFAGFVANEKAQDEREEKNRASAGRTGYLLGLCVLVIGVAVQTFSHQTVDSWLVIGILVMVTGKSLSHLYARKFK